MFISIFIFFINFFYIIFDNIYCIIITIILFRWLSKDVMVNRYLEIYEELVQVCEHDDTNLNMDTSEEHYENVVKLSKLMEPLYFVSRELQKKHLSITKARKLLSHVDEEVLPELYRKYGFTCNTDRISDKFDVNPLINDKTDEVYEQTVIKLQKKQAADMDDCQRLAAKPFLKKEYMMIGSKVFDRPSRATAVGRENREEVSEEMISLFTVMNEPDAEDENDKYHDASFVCASTAEVERLWSICSMVLTSSRTKVSKDLFEAIIFLRYNFVHWGVEDVKMACAFENNDEAFPSSLKSSFEEIEVLLEEEEEYELFNSANEQFEYEWVENDLEDDDYSMVSMGEFDIMDEDVDM